MKIVAVSRMPKTAEELFGVKDLERARRDVTKRHRYVLEQIAYFSPVKHEVWQERKDRYAAAIKKVDEAIDILKGKECK